MYKKLIAPFIISIFLLVTFYHLYMTLAYDDITALELFNSDANFIFDFYAQHIRGHLFGAFLGLGGFLLSLKTFIIVNMKENLYDNDIYKDHWKKNRQYNDKSLYEPLKELSDMLYFAIFSCIVASISQMTLGFVQHDIFALLSLFLGIFATVLLISSLLIIKENLDIWFEHIDD